MARKKSPPPAPSAGAVSGGKRGATLRRLAAEDDPAALFAGQEQEQADFASLIEKNLPDRELTKILAEKEAEPPPALSRPPRRKEAVAEPQEQLDLHGCTGSEAETRAGRFLASALRNRLRTVLIVTGKGLHSPQGPVLKDVVESLLRLWREEGKILDYAWEKKNREESGALLVHLPPPQ